MLKIFKIVIAVFQVINKLSKVRLFYKILLLANISMGVVLRMLFLSFNNANIQFVEKELIWRSNITAEALPTTKKVELIDKNYFANVVLDENIEAFVMHIKSLRLKIMIHSITKVHIALLLAKKVSVLVDYSDFANVFLEKSANILSEQTRANNLLIKL